MKLIAQNGQKEISGTHWLLLPRVVCNRALPHKMRDPKMQRVAVAPLALNRPRWTFSLWKAAKTNRVLDEAKFSERQRFIKVA